MAAPTLSGPPQLPSLTPGYLIWPRIQGLMNQWSRASGKERLAYAVFGIFGLVFWIGLFAGLVWLVGAFHEVEVFGPLLTRKLLELLLLSLFAMLMFSNVVTSLSTFYLSDDLELLLSLPISRPLFHYARLAETFFQSSWMMAMFGVPLFLAYGIVHGAGWTYYAALALVVPAFLIIPVSFGVGVASILVSTFPARRTRELLTLMGVFSLIGVFGLLRYMRPERLINAQDFESLASYVAELQAPVPTLLPSRWASDVLLATLTDRAFPWVEMGLLLTGAVALTGAARWLTDRLYADGWTRSQEARQARLAKAGWFDAALESITSPLPSDLRPFVIKDVKVFIRDPAQWSQIFLLLSLIFIYLFSVYAFPTDILKGPFMKTFKNLLAFMNLGMAGFVMAGIAARFQFSAVSTEGRAFWMVRTGPVDPERYLWAKALPGMLPMVLVGEILIIASSVILESPGALLAIGAANGLGLAFGISGIAVGLGATFPNFKVDNAARVAGGPAGILFMVSALTLVGTVIALEAYPVYLLLRTQYTGEGITEVQLGVSAILCAIAAVFCAIATVYPIKRAASGLWERNL